MMAQLQQNVKGSRSSEGEIPLQSVEHHWSTIFKKYDTDNDGRLSLRELCDQVNSPGFAHDIPEQAIRNIFRQFDVNNDGYINFDEFLSLLESDVGRRLWNRTLNRYIKNTVVPRGPKRVFTHRRGHIDSTDGDYEDQYSCVPPPICMFLVSAVEIGFFLYDIASYGNNDKITGFGPAAQLFYYSPHKRSQFWRFITYMFVHANFFHLIVNLAVQVLLGVPLEMVHRWWRVLIIYLAGVLAGSLATSVSDPEVSLAGASGGVYAIITAHLSTIILNWSEMEFAVWQLIIFLLLMIVDIGQYIYARYFIETQLKIGYVAHLGGAVAGLLVGLYVLRNLDEHSWEKVLKWIGFILYIFLIGFAIFYNVYYVVT